MRKTVDAAAPRDPFGHRWSIATPQRQVRGKDLEEAAKVAVRNPDGCQGAKTGSAAA